MSFFTLADSMTGYLSDTVALAAVAFIGYLFGHRTRLQTEMTGDKSLQAELYLATNIAKELQQIADRVRRDVASHQARIFKFTSRVQALQNSTGQKPGETLSMEAETLLTPTRRLTSNLSLAYDQIRKQSSQLMSFASSRIDLSTGLYNRRVLREKLEELMSIHNRTGAPFSLALFTRSESGGEKDETCALLPLISLARIVESSARNTDVIIRYSDDEVAVLMPQTTLAGASLLCERLMRGILDELSHDIAVGVVDVLNDDDPQKFLSRVDSALYSARARGGSCLFQHNGTSFHKFEPNPLDRRMSQETALV